MLTPNSLQVGAAEIVGVVPGPPLSKPKVSASENAGPQAQPSISSLHRV